MTGKAIAAAAALGMALCSCAVRTTGAEESHPRVMFGKDDIPALREKMKKEPWASWYKLVKDKSDSSLQTPTAEITGFNARWSSVALGFAYTIEGDRKYALKSRDILLAIPAEVIASRETNAELRSYSGQSYPLAYDMIYDALTPGERAKIEERIRTALVSMFTLAKTQYNGNIRSVYAEALGTMGLALGEKAWVDQARAAMEGVLDNCIMGEGAFWEGQSYAMMGVGELMQFMTALRRIPGEKDYFQHPQVIKALDFMVLCASPLGTSPCFEDSLFGDSGIAMLFRANGQMPVPRRAKAYNWLKKRYETFFSPVKVGGNAAIDGVLLDLLIVDRLETDTAEPWEVSGVYPGAGLAFLRSGWDPEALYLAISCKDYVIRPHVHGDENSIELWAYGAYILANAGYPGWEDKRHWWCAETEASNTILMDGKGQLRAQCNARVADGFGKDLLTDFVDYVEARGTRLYDDNGGGFNRNVLFVKPSKDAPGYYILIDKMKTAKADAAIDWILHGRGSLEIGPQTAAWKVDSFVTKKPVTLTARIITPQVKITRKMGYNATENKDIPYILARSDKPATYVVVCYPTREGQKLPEINQIDRLDAVAIGSADLVLTQEGNKDIKVREVKTDAAICFVRKDRQELGYFFAAGARTLAFKDKPIFTADKSITAALRYEKDIAGVISADEETTVSLASADRPVTVTVNGKEVPVAYRDGILTLKLKGRNVISIAWR